MNGFNVAEFNAGLSLRHAGDLPGDRGMRDLDAGSVSLRCAAPLDRACLRSSAWVVTAVLAAVQPVSGRVVALGGLFELDRMAQVLKVVTLLTVAVVFVYSDRLSEAPGDSQGRVLRARIVRHARRHGADLRGQLDHALLGARVDVLVLVRHGRLRPRFRHCRRIRHQVFRAGLDGFRNAVVRHVDRVRGHRQSGACGDRDRRAQRLLGQHRAGVRHRISHRRRWDSSWARCRFTCGFRTCTRARPPA